MNFKYRQVNLKNPFQANKLLLRPIIPLSISNGSFSIRFEALIDSGADFSIFPLEIADRLNVISRGKEKIYFSGIGGNLSEGFIATVSISLGMKKIKTKVVFSDVLEVTGVLGQYGFFDKWKLIFDLKKKEFEIT